MLETEDLKNLATQKMDRTIKFRGKHFNEWVYGDLLQTTILRLDEDYQPNNITVYQIRALVGWSDYDTFTVDSNTIGQYTGLKDMYGKEIYEGDIVDICQFLFDGSEHEEHLVGVVSYMSECGAYGVTQIKNDCIRKYMGYQDNKEDLEAFKEECIPLCNLYGIDGEDCYEVLGNVYDDKELLNKEKQK